MKMRPVRWISRIFKRFIPAIIAVSALSAIVSLCSIALILVMRNMLDDAQAGITGNALYGNIITLVGLLLFEIAVNAVNNLLRGFISCKMDMHIKKRLYEQLIIKDYGEITKLHSGELLNRFTSDVDVVVRVFSTIIPSAVSIVTKLVAGIAAVLLLDPIVAAVIIVIGFIFPLFGRLISNRLKHLHKEAQQSDGKVRSFMQDSIQNIVVIKTFLADNPIKNRLMGLMEDSFKIKMKRNVLSVATHSSLFGTFTLGYYAVIVWGAIGIAAGTVTYGTFIAFLQLVSQLRNPLQNISGLLPQYYSMVASAERLMEIEDIKDEPVAEPPQHTRSLYDQLEFIEAQELCFAYDGEHNIIDNSTFSIKKGNICAIMGESGIGKSTLFRLLLGLYRPQGGRLTLNTHRESIELSSAHRGLFSYVPQGVMVLSGTIRDNITLLSGNVDEERLCEVARQAVIYDFISSLPDGFNTVVGERGLGLSEGQLQRIAIARALLLDAPILLLDECTSALDLDTEKKLLKNLRERGDKTVILITHRRAALDICDTVLTVKDGKIKEAK